MSPFPVLGVRLFDLSIEDRATVIEDLLHGQFHNPVRVVAFNTVEGWSADASEACVRSPSETKSRAIGS